MRNFSLSEGAGGQGFDFDYGRNIIKLGDKVIRLTPHEADILCILLDNRVGPTPMGHLIQGVYGASEPKEAATSMRVAIRSLRVKIRQAGIVIRNTRKIGYEIDVADIPELNRRLSDKILSAINIASAFEETELVEHLRAAYDFSERNRRKWRPRPKLDKPPDAR